MSEYESLEFDVSPDGVAAIILNRPDQRNAFNAEMIDELTDVFETLEGADGVRLLILRGAGKAFSAGADLAWMKRAATYTKEDNERDAFKLAEMLRKLAELPMPTLALVHGAAMGGGAGLVAACDVAVAQKSTKFSFSEIRLGLTPATISPYVMAAIGPRWTKALFVTGETFDGTYAERMGLVHYVVETDKEMTEMEEYLASLIFKGAPGAIVDSKRLVLDFANDTINEHLSHQTAKRIAERRASDEGKEGIAAFLDKRKASWTGEES